MAILMVAITSSDTTDTDVSVWFAVACAWMASAVAWHATMAAENNYVVAVRMLILCRLRPARKKHSRVWPTAGDWSERQQGHVDVGWRKV